MRVKPSNLVKKEVHHEDFVRYWKIEVELKNLAGKVLTIIDASVVNLEQKKAMKDLIKADISKAIYNFQEIAWNNEKGHSVRLNEYKSY